MDPDTFDALSTADLLDVAAAMADGGDFGDSDEHWAAVSELRRRAEQAVFNRALEWCASPNPRLRALGADVLGQLGAPHMPFATESTPALVALLQDQHEDVVVGALHALGHLRAGAAAELAAFTQHESSSVRQAAAHALSGREEPVALDALSLLTADVNRDVRNWATFALGSLSVSDAAEVRDALAARLADDDDEIRGEAIVGLAHRRDPRAVAAIAAELGKAEISSLAIEAAEIMPTAEFVVPLRALVRSAPTDDAVRALATCETVANGPSA